MKYTSTFLWLSAALLSAAPADKTLNLSIYDTTSTSFLNRAFTVSGNNGKVLGISGGDWALVTASGSSSLTSTQIAYGDGSNVQTSEAAFAYDSTFNILSVDAIKLFATGVGISTASSGVLKLEGLGSGFDEAINMDFDTISNVVQTSSPLTGVTIMDYLDMSLRVTDGGGNFATLGPSGITVHNSAWAGNYTLDFGGTDGANEEIASKEWVNAQGFGGSLTATYVGYGDGANALTGEAAFAYTAASDLLTVPNITVSGTATLGTLAITNLNTTNLALGGVTLTATGTELNILDGVTSSASELNYVDGVTSAIQTQLNALKSTQITYYIGNGSDVITTGYKGSVRIPYSGTMTGVRITSQDASTTSGAIVIDVWKDVFANFPPTNADSITASDKPTITASATNSEDTNIATWTGLAITSGDEVGFEVESVSSFTKIRIDIFVTKN